MSDENDYEVTSEEESLPELPEQRDDTGDWKEQVEEDTEQHYWQRENTVNDDPPNNGMWQRNDEAEELDFDEEQARADEELFEREGARGVMAREEEQAYLPENDDEDDGFGGFVEEDDDEN